MAQAETILPPGKHMRVVGDGHRLHDYWQSIVKVFYNDILAPVAQVRPNESGIVWDLQAADAAPADASDLDDARRRLMQANDRVDQVLATLKVIQARRPRGGYFVCNSDEYALLQGLFPPTREMPSPGATSQGQPGQPKVGPQSPSREVRIAEGTFNERFQLLEKLRECLGPEQVDVKQVVRTSRGPRIIAWGLVQFHPTQTVKLTGAAPPPPARPAPARPAAPLAAPATLISAVPAVAGAAVEEVARAPVATGQRKKSRRWLLLLLLLALLVAAFLLWWLWPRHHLKPLAYESYDSPAGGEDLVWASPGEPVARPRPIGPTPVAHLPPMPYDYEAPVLFGGEDLCRPTMPVGVVGIREGFRFRLKGGGATTQPVAALSEKVFYQWEGAAVDVFMEDNSALPIVGKVGDKRRFLITQGANPDDLYEVTGWDTDLYYWIGAELKNERMPRGLEMTIVEPQPAPNDWVFLKEPVKLQNVAGKERYFFFFMVPAAYVAEHGDKLVKIRLVDSAGMVYPIERIIGPTGQRKPVAPRMGP